MDKVAAVWGDLITDQTSNLLSFCKTAELYVSDREGNDATGDGTKEKPFKTGLKVVPLPH